MRRSYASSRCNFERNIRNSERRSTSLISRRAGGNNHPSEGREEDTTLRGARDARRVTSNNGRFRGGSADVTRCSSIFARTPPRAHFAWPHVPLPPRRRSLLGKQGRESAMESVPAEFEVRCELRMRFAEKRRTEF